VEPDCWADRAAVMHSGRAAAMHSGRAAAMHSVAGRTREPPTGHPAALKWEAPGSYGRGSQ
jgi:hypothetical protein